MRGRIAESVQRIYEAFGDKPFQWIDVKNLGLDISPVSFKYSGFIKKIGRGENGLCVYRITDKFTKAPSEKPTKYVEPNYRIRRKPHSTNFYVSNLINRYQGGKKEVKKNE